MADIMLHTSNTTGFTCISNTFIDDFMKDANGEYVKVYLYLLRCLGREGFDFSISQLADCLDHTEKDVMRAFAYWEKVGLLRLEYSSDNELSGICLVDVNGTDSSFTSVHNTAAPSVAVRAGAPAVSNKNLVPAKPSYSADQLDAFRDDDEIADRQGRAALDLPEPVISFQFRAEPDAQDIPFLSGKHIGNVQLDFICFEVGGQEFGDSQLVIGGIQRIPFVAVADA